MAGEFTPEMKENVRKKVLDEATFGPIVDDLFRNADTDNSGKIDIKELEALLTQLGNILGIKPPTKQETLNELKRLDKNSDGQISKQEFRELVKDLVLLVVDSL